MPKTNERYWRVSPRFWASAERWSDDAKLLGAYLITCPHRTLEGLFRLPKAYISADLGWTAQRLGKPFAELLADGFIEYDEDVSVILLTGALDFQSPENPNQIKAAVRKLEELPKTPLTCTFKRLAERFCQPLAEALPEGFGEPLALALALSLAPAQADQSANGSEAEPSEADQKAAEIDAWFEDFWSAYPRRVGRKKAKQSFVTALKTATVDEIAAGLQPYLAKWRHEAEARADWLNYVPHPATWLNQQRWNDEVSA